MRGGESMFEVLEFGELVVFVVGSEFYGFWYVFEVELIEL